MHSAAPDIARTRPGQARATGPGGGHRWFSRAVLFVACGVLCVAATACRAGSSEDAAPPKEARNAEIESLVESCESGWTAGVHRDLLLATAHCEFEERGLGSCQAYQAAEKCAWRSPKAGLDGKGSDADRLFYDLIDHESAQVRFVAAQFLGKVPHGDPEMRAGIAHRIEVETHPLVLSELLSSIVDLDRDPQLTTQFLAALGHVSPAVRFSAVGQLAYDLPDPEVTLPRIEAVLAGDPSVEVRTWACHRLDGRREDTVVRLVERHSGRYTEDPQLAASCLATLISMWTVGPPAPSELAFEATLAQLRDTRACGKRPLTERFENAWSFWRSGDPARRRPWWSEEHQANLRAALGDLLRCADADDDVRSSLVAILPRLGATREDLALLRQAVDGAAAHDKTRAALDAELARTE